MMTMNMTSAIKDFKWVIKLLKSSKSKEHLDTTLRCFNLWENKHTKEILTEADADAVKHMRYQFWCFFKNKNSRFGLLVK